jgi:ankyrin repeat protein
MKHSAKLGVRCFLAACIFGGYGISAAADSRLMEAVRRGDLDAVQSLISQRVDVNEEQGDGATALMWATHRDDKEMIDLLLASGAEAKAANELGVTAVSLSCTNRNSSVVDQLLRAGADANAAQVNGETVLMTCAKTGAVEAVRSLLAHGADPRAREHRRSQTALMFAASGKHSDVVRSLIEGRADVNAASATGFTALMFAAQQGGVELARMLIDVGADVNAGTPDGWTPLLVASASRNEEVGILLLERGAKPNVADEYGITPLHYAMRRGLSFFVGLKFSLDFRARPENLPGLAKSLLTHGADPNAQIKKALQYGPETIQASMVGATPFLLAAVAADADLMQAMADAGAHPSTAARGGITPLMAAAGAAREAAPRDEEEELWALEAVRVAVEFGAELNARNDDGQTAMHAAAFTGAASIVRYLAEVGTHVDVPDDAGETPWSMAVGISPVLRYRGLYGSHESTAKLLLELGARKRTREEMYTLSNASRNAPEATKISEAAESSNSSGSTEPAEK